MDKIQGIKRIVNRGYGYTQTKRKCPVLGGLVLQLSTSQGVMTDKTARREGGWRRICYVW